MNFSTEEMATAATIFSLFHLLLHHLPIFLIGDRHFCLPIYLTYLTFRGLTNFLIAMISNGFVPPAPDPPPLRGFARTFFPNGPSTAKNSSNVGINMAKHLSNLGTNTTQIVSGDRLIRELEKVIEKEKTKRRNCLL